MQDDHTTALEKEMVTGQLYILASSQSVAPS